MIDDLQALTPQPTYQDWPTKAEAAQTLELSTRQIERLIGERKIQTAYRKVPHRRAACVCNPSDVAKLAGERRAAQPFVAPEGIQSPTDPESAAMVARNSPLDVSSIVRMAIDLVTAGASATAAALPRSSVPITQKAYLTIEQAEELSGLPRSYLHTQIRNGSLRVIKADRWLRIERASLMDL